MTRGQLPKHCSPNLLETHSLCTINPGSLKVKLSNQHQEIVKSIRQRCFSDTPLPKKYCVLPSLEDCAEHSFNLPFSACEKVAAVDGSPWSESFINSLY